MSQIMNTILPSQAKPSQAKPSQAKPELAGGLPGAWAGAAFAPFAGQCPLRDRRATRPGGYPRPSFIDSCSRLSHAGYEPKWHGLLRAPTDETL